MNKAVAFLTSCFFSVLVAFVAFCSLSPQLLLPERFDAVRAVRWPRVFIFCPLFFCRAAVAAVTN